MALFQTERSLDQVLGASLKAEPAAFDPFWYDADFRAAHKSLLEGSHQEAASLITIRPDGWLLSSALISADSQVQTETFMVWLEEDPSDIAYALTGNAMIRDSWAIRGTRRAEHVASESWEPFHDGLRIAEEVLWEGVRQYPKSPEPWVGLVTIARGLGHGLTEVHKRFSEAHKRAPFRSDICAAMFQGVCEKWGGSHAEMFNFARWVDLNAPADSPARSLVPLAHFERVIAGDSDGLLPSEYFVEPEVSDELVRVGASYLKASPIEAQPVHLEMLNLLLLVLQPHDEASARLVEECAHRLGDRPTSVPWLYYGGNIGRRFAAVKAERLGEAKLF